MQTTYFQQSQGGEMQKNLGSQTLTEKHIPSDKFILTFTLFGLSQVIKAASYLCKIRSL